jgi:hypothetical protein
MNIETEALRLAKLNKRADEALDAGDIDGFLDLISERVTAVERLREALLNNSVHIVRSPEARHVLAEIDLSDIEDADATAGRLLFSWFAPKDYVLGLSCVDALIAPVSVPDALRKFVEEARRC